MSEAQVIVEVEADDTTYGEIIDYLLIELHGILFEVRLSLRTPSSHSSPTIELTFEDSPENRELIAAAFNRDADEVTWSDET